MIIVIVVVMIVVVEMGNDDANGVVVLINDNDTDDYCLLIVAVIAVVVHDNGWFLPMSRTTWRAWEGAAATVTWASPRASAEAASTAAAVWTLTFTGPVPFCRTS